MSPDEEKQVANYVLKKGLVTREELQQGLARWKEARRAGESPDLLSLLVEQGLMTQSQGEAVRAAVLGADAGPTSAEPATPAPAASTEPEPVGASPAAPPSAEPSGGTGKRRNVILAAAAVVILAVVGIIVGIAMRGEPPAEGQREHTSAEPGRTEGQPGKQPRLAPGESTDVTSWFAGKCSDLGDGKIRLSYDFSDEKQLGDWTAISGSDPDGGWSIEAGTLRSNGRFKLCHEAPFAGDVELELRLVSTARLAAHVLSPGKTAAPTGYRFYWRCDAAQAYAGAVAGRKYLFRETPNVPGFHADKPATVSFVCRGQELSYRINGRAVKTASELDTTYEKGFILLSSQAEPATIEAVTITGTLEPDWAEARIVDAVKPSVVTIPDQEAQWQSLIDDQSLANWVVSGGDWSVANNEIVVSCTREPGLLYGGDVYWKDYVFEAKVLIESGSACGIMARLRRMTSDYVISYEYTGPRFVATAYRFGITDEGSLYYSRRNRKSEVRTSAAKAVDGGLNRWHEVSCRVDDEGVSLRIDGRVIPIRLKTDPATRATLDRGGVGLFCHENTKARFKDVRVKILSRFAGRPVARAPQIATRKPVSPPAAGPDVAAQTQRERELADLWQFVQKSVAENPQDDERHLRNYRMVIESAKGTKYERMAREAIRKIEQKATGETAKLLRDLQDQAAKFAGQREFPEALAVFTRLPEELAGSEWRLQVEAAKAVVLQKAESAFRADLDLANGLAEQGRFDDAKKRLSPALSWGIDQIERSAKAALARIEKQEQQGMASAAKEAEREYRDVARRAREHAGQMQFELALAVVKEALAKPSLAAIRDSIREDQAHLAAAARVWQSAQDGAKALVGKRFTVRGIRGVVKSVSDGKITVESGGATVTESLDRLRPKEIFALAARTLDPEAAETRIQFGLFHFFAGRTKDAEKELAAAKEAGADVAQYEERIRRVARLAHEGEAAALYQRAMEAHKQGDFAGFRKLAAQLKEECGDTELYADKKEELERTLRAVHEKEAEGLFRRAEGAESSGDAGTAEQLARQLKRRYFDTKLFAAKVDVIRKMAREFGVEDAFYGKCVDLGDGRVRLEYDFSDPKQLKDWATRTPTKWTILDGALVAVDRGVIGLLPPFEGDLAADLTLDMIAKSSEQLCIVLLSPRVTDYYHGYHFEWRWQRSTRTEYVQSADGARRAVRTPWRRIQLSAGGRRSGHRLFRKEVSADGPDAEGPVDLSVARRGAELSYSVDGELVGSGTLPEAKHQRGYFVLSNEGREARIRKVVVTGTPDPNWVKARLARRKVETTVIDLSDRAEWQSLFDGRSIRNWVLCSGKWKARNNEIQATCHQKGYLMVGDESWKDYVFQTKLRMVGSACGFVVRARTKTARHSPTRSDGFANGYTVGITGIDRVYASYRIDGRSWGSSRADGAFDKGPNEWHELTCTVKGDEITVQIDGKEVTLNPYVDPTKKELLDRGKIGLYCGGDTQARFKDVRIKVLSKYPGR